MSSPSSAPQGPSIPGASPKRLLGAGGFADVFLYEQRVPRRDVAVNPAARRHPTRPPPVHH